MEGGTHGGRKGEGHMDGETHGERKGGHTEGGTH